MARGSARRKIRDNVPDTHFVRAFSQLLDVKTASAAGISNPSFPVDGGVSAPRARLSILIHVFDHRRPFRRAHKSPPLGKSCAASNVIRADYRVYGDKYRMINFHSRVIHTYTHAYTPARCNGSSARGEYDVFKAARALHLPRPLRPLPLAPPPFPAAFLHSNRRTACMRGPPSAFFVP